MTLIFRQFTETFIDCAKPLRKTAESQHLYIAYQSFVFALCQYVKYYIPKSFANYFLQILNMLVLSIYLIQILNTTACSTDISLRYAFALPCLSRERKIATFWISISRNQWKHARTVVFSLIFNICADIQPFCFMLSILGLKAEKLNIFTRIIC